MAAPAFQVPLPGTTDSVLRETHPLVELRQCPVLHAAFAGLVSDQGEAPELKYALDLAGQMRAHMWQESAEALGHLGDPPPLVSAEEYTIRGTCHDALHLHHEKGYMTFRSFPPPQRQARGGRPAL